MVVPHENKSYQKKEGEGKAPPDPFAKFDEVAALMRPAFGRQATCDWFSTLSLGLATREDDLGVSAAVRALRLERQAYGSLIGCLRSNAWSPQGVIERWQGVVPRVVPILTYNGRAVMPADGCKVSKEAERMPAVKRLKQDSEDSSKGNFIFGHMTGAVGVLAGAVGACECIPLDIGIQDGMRAAAEWDGASELGIVDEPHTLQCARMMCRAATNTGLDAYGLFDRFFMCSNVFVPILEHNEAARAEGGPTVELVTRCRRGRTTCYLDPPPREPGKRGAPAKKGAAVRPFEVIEEILGPEPRKAKGKRKGKGKAGGDTVAEPAADAEPAATEETGDAPVAEDVAKAKKGRKKMGTALSHEGGERWEFVTVTARIRGEEHEYRALVLDLLWGEGLYARLRFVLARDDEGRDLVYVTTDLTLTAAQVIELYSLRWPCEPMFRIMKQDTMGFGYRFWSRVQPVLNRRSKRGDPDPLEAVEDQHERDLILGAYAAIARWLALACVTTGTLQAIALAQPDDGAVAYHEFKRTEARDKVSVATVRSYLRKGVSAFILSDEKSTIAAFIREHLVGEGGYAPSAQRKGRK